MRNHYPKSVVYILVFMLCLSNIFNLGADFAAMGSATQLVMGGKAVLYVTIFGVVSIFLQVFIHTENTFDTSNGSPSRFSPMWQVFSLST